MNRESGDERGEMGRLISEFEKAKKSALDNLFGRMERPRQGFLPIPEPDQILGTWTPADGCSWDD